MLRLIERVGCSPSNLISCSRTRFLWKETCAQNATRSRTLNVIMCSLSVQHLYAASTEIPVFCRLRTASSSMLHSSKVVARRGLLSLAAPTALRTCSPLWMVSTLTNPTSLALLFCHRPRQSKRAQPAGKHLALSQRSLKKLSATNSQDHGAPHYGCARLDS
jgi:hypothetical protein